MSVIETLSSAEKADSFWNAIEKHLDGTTPNKALGLPEGVPTSALRRAYLRIKSDLIKQANTPDRQLAMERNETAYLAATSEFESRIYNQWLQFKEHTAHNAEIKQLPLNKEAQQRLEQIAEASRSFIFKKPVIALGATALAATSIMYAVKATERIREKNEAGETPERSDRALQALGLAGAAGVISAAVLMWKNGGHVRG